MHKRLSRGFSQWDLKIDWFKGNCLHLQLPLNIAIGTELLERRWKGATMTSKYIIQCPNCVKAHLWWTNIDRFGDHRLSKLHHKFLCAVGVGMTYEALQGQDKSAILRKSNNLLKQSRKRITSTTATISPYVHSSAQLISWRNPLQRARSYQWGVCNNEACTTRYSPKWNEHTKFYLVEFFPF